MDHDASTAAGQRLRTALAARHRADAALRAAARDIADAAPGQNGTLADELARTCPDLPIGDLELAAAAADVLEPDDTSSSTPTPRPVIPPVTYLRGAGVDSRTFDRVHAALWRHGVWTTSDRTRAMHLSRGGLPVWMVDFSTTGEPGPDTITISQVRAVFEPGHQRMDFKRAASRAYPRPLRADRLDTRALAELVAATTVLMPTI